MYAYSQYSKLRADLEAGVVTCRALVEQCLQACETHKNLNAFLELYAEEALQRADELDSQFRAGRNPGRMAGMVIALKDVICHKDHEVSASSKILKGFKSLYNATVTERMLREGAIIIGRTNCDEFAMGASNENSAFGPVLNAVDPTRVPGGSSGGSAVAVQTGMCHAALGSDTGGSIRQPAAFTGTVGLKPTYGRISRWGLLAYASSFDQIGPMTRTVADAALLLEVIAGPDEHDATCAAKPVDAYASALNSSEMEPLRIAYLGDALEHPGLDPEIRERSFALFETLCSKGHQVESVSFPYLDYMVPCYYVLTTAEASSNLSRYAGLTYGYRSASAHDLESTFKRSRSEGFGPEVKRRIMLGTFVLSSDFYDAYYSKAQKVRRVIREKTTALLEQYDFLILPTTSTPPFRLGEKADNPIAMYLADLFTVQANLAGNPAISIPAGTNSAGLPFGMQVMAADFKEAAMLRFSEYLSGLLS
ncbi:MAG: Asp-tRNA(Asn)/Glu-tRNA(Gln) amidotransferase subunit GatA [Bacteroidetes bacterium]|nr:Asp-tRNA(Asn)/Glu-tRNA(Gln) amidotransferase subunit GatA [Bacteroidota bacterium]